MKVLTCSCVPCFRRLRKPRETAAKCSLEYGGSGLSGVARGMDRLFSSVLIWARWALSSVSLSRRGARGPRSAMALVMLAIWEAILVRSAVNEDARSRRLAWNCA